MCRGVLFVVSVVLRGCLTSLVGLFHEQEQVVQGDALPVVRGAHAQEGFHERGQAAVAVPGLPVQRRAGAGVVICYIFRLFLYCIVCYNRHYVGS